MTGEKTKLKVPRKLKLNRSYTLNSSHNRIILACDFDFDFETPFSAENLLACVCFYLTAVSAESSSASLAGTQQARHQGLFRKLNTVHGSHMCLLVMFALTSPISTVKQHGIPLHS